MQGRGFPASTTLLGPWGHVGMPQARVSSTVHPITVEQSCSGLCKASGWGWQLDGRGACHSFGAHMAGPSCVSLVPGGAWTYLKPVGTVPEHAHRRQLARCARGGRRLLDVADNNTLGELVDREDVANGESGLLAAVDECTTVKATSGFLW